MTVTTTPPLPYRRSWGRLLPAIETDIGWTVSTAEDGATSIIRNGPQDPLLNRVRRIEQEGPPSKKVARIEFYRYNQARARPIQGALLFDASGQLIAHDEDFYLGPHPGWRLWHVYGTRRHEVSYEGRTRALLAVLDVEKSIIEQLVRIGIAEGDEYGHYGVVLTRQTPCHIEGVRYRVVTNSEPLQARWTWARLH